MFHFNTLNTQIPLILGSALYLFTPAITLAESDKLKEGVEEVSVEKSAQSYLKDLESKDFEVRKKAMQELWKLGRKILPEIKKQLNSPDPEVRFSVKLLLRFIEAGFTPDTPPRVIELVNSISTSKNQNQVSRELDELVKLNAHKPILYLSSSYEQEGDGAKAIKTLLRNQANVSLLILLRSTWSKGDFIESEELIKEVPLEGVAAQMLVETYDLQNRLDELKGKYPISSDVYGYLAIYLNDVEGYHKYAQEKGLTEAAARSNVLLGKPRQYIDSYIKNSLRNDWRKDPKRGENLARAFALADAKEANDIEQIKHFRAKLQAEYVLAMEAGLIYQTQGALLSNGETETFNSSFDQMYTVLPNNKFSAVKRYIKNSEQSNGLFRQIGLPQKDEELKAWAKRHHQRYRGDVDDQEKYRDNNKLELRKMLLVASLYNYRGQRDKVKMVLDPVTKGLRDYFQGEERKKEEVNEYVELLQELLSNGDDLSWYADGELKYLGKEECDVIVNNLCPNEWAVISVWQALKQDDFKVESFREFLSITGFIRGENALPVGEVQKRLLVKAAADEQLKEGVYLCAKRRGDIASFFKMADSVSKGKKDELSLLMEASFFFGKYEQFCKYTEANAEEEIIEGVNLLKWSIALRKLGKIKEAEEKLKEFKIQEVGETASWYTIAELHGMNGYKEISIKAFERFFLLFDPVKTNAHFVVNQFSDNFLFYPELEQWDRAYGLALVNKYYTIESALKESGIRPKGLLDISNHTDFCKGMFMLSQGDKNGEIFIKRAAEESVVGGKLAEVYFPALWKAGYDELRSDAFEHVKKEFDAALKDYPNGPNTLNSYAWTAARAGLDLENAKNLSERSLALQPHTPSYTDTLAEVHFAMGNREKAVEIGSIAVEQTTKNENFGGGDIFSGMYNSLLLRGQLERFKHDPLLTK